MSDAVKGEYAEFLAIFKYFQNEHTKLSFKQLRGNVEAPDCKLQPHKLTSIDAPTLLLPFKAAHSRRAPQTTMASQHTEEHTYHPQDAIGAALKATALTGGFGLFASAVQNTLAKQNVGPLGIFIRSGGTIAVFAAMGGTYSFVRTASANLRQTNDTYNTALGGFFAGSILGLRARTFPSVFGYGTALAVTLAAFEYTGGSLSGKEKDHNLDKYAELERIRTNYRTLAEQTFAELGEGRGIYGPGYAERRRERIKEAYGIDVPATPPPAS